MAGELLYRVALCIVVDRPCSHQTESKPRPRTRHLIRWPRERCRPTGRGRKELSGDVKAVHDHRGVRGLFAEAAKQAAAWMLFIAELDVFGPLTAGVGIDQLAKDGCEQMPDMWIRQETMS